MPETTAHFQTRAASFQTAAQLLNDHGLLDDDYRQRVSIGAALLAIHGAIAWGDAAMVVLTGHHIHPQQHGQAAELLRLACVRANHDGDGAKHFKHLLAKKNAIAYDNRRIDDDEVKGIILHWERFLVWIARSFPELQLPPTEGDLP